MALAETSKLMAELGLVDKLTPGLKKAGGSLDKFEGRLGKVAGGAGKVSAGFARAGTIIAGAAATGLAGAAKAAIDWEDAFQGVVKTVDASDADLQTLAATLREYSTTMPTTAIDMANIAEAAGAMGVGFDEATGKTNTATIAAFTKQVAILAETTNVTAEDAATSLGQLVNVLDLGADEFDNFAAALVDLGNKGASTESQILEITKRAGASAHNIDLAADATLAWASAAANLGLGDELAGTALQKFFTQSQRIISSGGADLKKFAKISGQSAKDFKKSFDKDASGALEDFLTGLGELPKDQRVSAIDDLFGKGTGIGKLILGLSDSMDKNLSPALDTASQAYKDATAAQAEFDKRNATVKSAIARFKNTVIDAAVTVGEGFAPALGNAASKLAEFLKLPENQTALKNLGRDIGQALDDIDWRAVLDGARDFLDVMKVALGFAKRIFDVFNALPTEVKGAAAGFIALNKLSGGLIGGGLGDIFGGLGSSLAKSLAASIPIFGRAFVQPVFVTNMGVGGLGGGLPGAAGAAGGIGLATLATGAVVTAAAAAAVIVAQQQISGNITAQSEAIRTGLDASVMGKSQEELKTALAGVERGIADISSNPLNVLVQGDALTNLHAMAATLKAAITPNPSAPEGADNRKSVGDIIAANLQVDAANRTTTAVEGAKGSLQTAIDLKGDATKGAVDGAKLAIDGAKRATEIGSSNVAAAIRNKDLSVDLQNTTKVTVNVSATGVKTTTTYQNRVGKSTGSHGGGSGAGAGYSGHAGGH